MVIIMSEVYIAIGLYSKQQHTNGNYIEKKIYIICTNNQQEELIRKISRKKNIFKRECNEFVL